MDDITRAFTSGRTLCIIQVDIESAYDCILRDCVFDVLERINFHSGFMDMLGTFYSRMEAQAPFRGESDGTFSMLNGLGQGDPLRPPYFFAVAMLPLSKAINRHCMTYSSGRREPTASSQ